MYGNGEDPAKSVTVHVEVDDQAIRIHVRDEGSGFDPAMVSDPTLPNALEEDSGRGLFLIRHLVDELHFNDKGNSLCMTLRRI